MVGTASSIYLCLQTLESVKNLKTSIDDQFSSETTEDDVVIAERYTIRSTLPISDAYKSGDDSALSDKEKEVLQMASNVLDEIITEDMTEYEKEIAVYDWMTSNLKNDSAMLSVIPSTTADSDNPYGVLKNKNGICVGYATTFRLFMQMLDIECKVIHNKENYHSWNLVKLDDDCWYHVDIYSDMGVGNYANFNENDNMLASSQEWDTTFFPASTGIKYNYAYQNATLVKDPYDMPNIIKKAMKKGKTSVFLKFSNLTDKDSNVVDTFISAINNKLQVSFDATDTDGEIITEDTDAYYTVNGNAYTSLGWQWSVVDSGEQLLTINLSKNDDDDESAISEEEYQEIYQKVDDIFAHDYAR
jgi:hypothetical protein